MWRSVHRPDSAVMDPAIDHRLQAGLAVHEVFRALYPDGRFVDDKDGLGEALRITERFLADGADRVFEATFTHEGVLVRADLIEKDRDAYALYEVKSSTMVKDYHLPDAAIQAWVIGGHIPVSRVFLTHIDNWFVYAGGGDYRGLFFNEDVTAQIRELQSDISARIDEFRTILAEDEPDIPPGAHCFSPFECPYHAYCTPDSSGPEHPVALLPGVSRIERLLIEEGFEDLKTVPRNRLTDPKHVRIWDAVHSGAAQIDSAIGDIVHGIQFPRYYFDFETIMFGVPIWPGTRPYQQLPFQYSCHVEQDGGETTHLEFLDVSGGPPMRPLAEQMITDLGTAGPIITYGHFERMVIGVLIELFPDLEIPLSRLQERIIDLLPILRQHYYHPDMSGSWSIKAVLPAIAPDLMYDALDEVHNGMEAQTAFLEAIHENCLPQRREALKRQLLTYCGLDSLAMVRIVRHFENMTHDGGKTGP
jgi:hypothetical protein